jgi:allantoinase
MKELSTGDFGVAWGGISSLQLSLPVVWTEARRRGFSLADVARWMAERQARLAGLPAKGPDRARLRRGLLPARPDESFVVDAVSCNTGIRSRPTTGTPDRRRPRHVAPR